jgi:Tol biopolymer transport system component
MLRTLAALLTIGIAGLAVGQAGQEQAATAPSDTANGSSSSLLGSMSTDGRYLVFDSGASDLVPGQVDVKGVDVFLYDRVAGTTVLVSHVPGSATTGNGRSYNPIISADGRWVAFWIGSQIFVYERETDQVTLAIQRITGDDPAIGAGGNIAYVHKLGLYLYERASGSTLLVNHAVGSTTRPGFIPNPDGNYPPDDYSMSADGRFIAFASAADNLIPGQNNLYGGSDVYLFDRLTGMTSLVSHVPGSALTSASGFAPRLSADGRYLAFASGGTDLISGLTEANSTVDVFLYDRLTGTTSLVTRSVESPSVTLHEGGARPAISADGSTVAYFSRDHRAGGHIWAYDRLSGQRSFITHSAESPSRRANSGAIDLALSANGRYLAFTSNATNLVPGQKDRGQTSDVFLYDKISATTVLVSHAANLATKAGNKPAYAPNISADGSWIAFSSVASDLVADKRDGNGLSDVFLYDRKTGTNRVVSLARKP